jgi:hypothetical protein
MATDRFADSFALVTTLRPLPETLLPRKKIATDPPNISFFITYGGNGMICPRTGTGGTEIHREILRSLLYFVARNVNAPRYPKDILRSLLLSGLCEKPVIGCVRRLSA